jgi:hypothetical protein
MPMTQDDAQRAQRLHEILLERNGRKEQIRELTERVNGFDAFRISLVRRFEANEALAGVLAEWRRRLAVWTAETDDRKLMHDIEVLSLKQVEIEKLLRAREETLVNKLRALDEEATGLVELNRSVREVRSAIEEHRKRLADLSIRSYLDKRCA